MKRKPPDWPAPIRHRLIYHEYERAARRISILYGQSIAGDTSSIHVRKRCRSSLSSVYFKRKFISSITPWFRLDMGLKLVLLDVIERGTQ